MNNVKLYSIWAVTACSLPSSMWTGRVRDVLYCYTEKEQAEKHAELAKCWVKENSDRMITLVLAERNKPENKNPYDPDWSWYSNTEYSVRELKLFIHIDQFQDQMN